MFRTILNVVRKETRNWLDSSVYDYETAVHMLESGRYIYVVFMCHLSLEKMLKALIHESTGALPPRSHDLIQLAIRAGITLPARMNEFVGKINAASLVTRYPEDLTQLLAAYPRDVTRTYLEQTREVLTWLREDKRLTT